MKGVININVTDMRSEPDFHSERVSQALFNEEVEILERQVEYCRVRSTDGYSGWIAGQFISDYREPKGEGPFVVSSGLAPAFEKDDLQSRRMTSIPYGCILYGRISGEFLQIQSERYGEFLVPLSKLDLAGSEAESLNLEEDHLVGETDKFLGVPYLWGGRSFFGIDCSGFSQTIMKRFGVALPRDTKDQIAVGREVNREEIKTGDLVFFPRHVAIAVSDTLMIHSSLNNGGVAYNSFDQRDPRYSRYLDESFTAARRLIS